MSEITDHIEQLVEKEIEKRSVPAYHETARLANILENRTTDLRFAEQELQDTKCALDNANEQIDGNEDRIDELENEVNSLNDDLERAEEELAQTKAKRVEAVDRIAELESGPKYYLREKIETLQNLIREQQEQIPSKEVQENHERNLRYCDAVTLWAGSWSEEMMAKWGTTEGTCQIYIALKQMYDAHNTVDGKYPWED